MGRKVATEKNVVLIGLSGTGKTTLGAMLADYLGLPFYDIDVEIEQREGKKISHIFQDEGEKYFRDTESSIAKELAAMPQGPAVISTGGGVVLRKENVQHLQETGLLIYLTASPEEIVDRLGNAEGRPLLQNVDRQEALVKIKKMIEKRNSMYLGAADFTVSTENKSPGHIVENDLASLVYQENKTRKDKIKNNARK